MNDIEKKIKEHRTLEATQKKYIGMNGKLATICKYLGSEMVLTSYDMDFDWEWLSANSPVMTMNIQDPYGNPIQQPSGDEWSQDQAPLHDFYQVLLGYHFDGLPWGMHLEIKLDLEQSRIQVYNSGTIVYDEIAGELRAYAPNKTWEGRIEKLYSYAREKQAKQEKVERVEKREENEQKKQRFLKRLLDRWGFK